jgi:hypothetical protein
MTLSGRVACGLLVLATCALAGCRQEEPQPIKVDGSRMTVDNLTGKDWSRVEVWLNDHYRALAPSVRASQRLIIPFDTFVAGTGQRFDAARHAPWSIELTAEAGDGTPVKLVWGKERWKVGQRPKGR